MVVLVAKLACVAGRESHVSFDSIGGGTRLCVSLLAEVACEFRVRRWPHSPLSSNAVVIICLLFVSIDICHFDFPRTYEPAILLRFRTESAYRCLK